MHRWDESAQGLVQMKNEFFTSLSTDGSGAYSTSVPHKKN